MNKIDIKNYGEAADFVNKCDDEDIPIYVETLCRKYKLPIDNYGLFREFTNHDSEEYFPLVVWEIEGGYLIN